MKKMGAKAVVVALAGVLAVGGVVGGTIAWLTDVTDPVVNTFTVGNVDITLHETDAETGEVTYRQSFKMVPGTVLTKDPVVTVEPGSEACWLFVEIEETDNFGSYLICGVDPQWKLLGTKDPGAVVEGVYYIKVPAVPATATEAVEYSVLLNNKVQVQPSVTKAMMDALEAANATLPSLTFTAYAIQQDNVAMDATGDDAKAQAAWELLKSQS